MLASWAIAIFFALNAGRLVAWVWSVGTHPILAAIYTIWIIVACHAMWRIGMIIITREDSRRD